MTELPLLTAHGGGRPRKACELRLPPQSPVCEIRFRPLNPPFINEDSVIQEILRSRGLYISARAPQTAQNFKQNLK